MPDPSPTQAASRADRRGERQSLHPPATPGRSRAVAGGALGLALLAPAVSLGPASTRTRSPARRGVAAAGWSTRTAGRSPPPTSTSGRSTPPSRRTPTPSSWARRWCVVRLDPATLQLPPDAGLGAASGILAFSKICTHAGCAIALYRAPLFQPVEPTPALVCPCHYSTFDPATGGTVALRAGRPAAAAAAAGDRRRGQPARGRELLGPGRPLLVGRPRPEGDLVIEKTARSLDEHTHTAPFGIAALRYIFPDHWSFLLGEIALYAFIVLVGTGRTWRSSSTRRRRPTVYHGSYAPLQGAHMTEAYRSALHISLEVKAGLLMRQTHHWAADVFIAAIALHLMRVFFTGAFRRPRQLTYYVGLTILMAGASGGLSRLQPGRRPALRDGPRHRLRRGALDPARRRQRGRAHLGRPVSRRPGVLVAHVHRARVRAAGDPGHADRHPSLPRVVAPPHAVSGRSANREAAARGTGVPRSGAALAGAHVRRVRRPVHARRPRPDQPDLALGPVSRRRRHQRCAARLVPRLADRRASADAGVRRHDRRPHGHPEPLLGRGALSHDRVRRACPVADGGAHPVGRPGAAQPARPAPRRTLADRDSERRS